MTTKPEHEQNYYFKGDEGTELLPHDEDRKYVLISRKRSLHITILYVIITVLLSLGGLAIFKKDKLCHDPSLALWCKTALQVAFIVF
jgi:hypothetical protein